MGLQELVLTPTMRSRVREQISDLRISGRTTFVNTLCGKSVLKSKDADDYHNAHLEEGVRIKPITVGEFKEISRNSVIRSLMKVENWNWMRKAPVYL